ncbi:hypothetical protein LCGC14_1521310 [marine sediment metagenome]|uniref:Calcineurin-like phosphoesterase domain-containing protein n=1 Tax=marine sediment metagenome TaxID=412755 RepID=A0A0F9IYS5_9ZZZZ
MGQEATHTVTQNSPGSQILQSLYLEHLNKKHDGTIMRGVGKIGKWCKCAAPQTFLDKEEAQQRNKNLKCIDTDRIFVWSDHHFGHKNIIKFSDRPFQHMDEMHEHMIANHNDYVGPTDVCFWVGDVAFMGATEMNKFLARCMGYNILIVGNHDFDKNKLKKYNFDEIHLMYHIEVDDFENLPLDFVFTHYPMWNLPRPAFNIHGHTHSIILNDPFKINVCVEIVRYRPTTLQSIIERAVLTNKTSLETLLTK